MSATTCDYQKIWKVTGTKCGKHGKTAREVTSQGVCNGAGNSCNGFFVLNPRTTPSHRCHLSEKPTGDSGHKVAIKWPFQPFFSRFQWLPWPWASIGAAYLPRISLIAGRIGLPCSPQAACARAQHLVHHTDHGQPMSREKYLEISRNHDPLGNPLGNVMTAMVRCTSNEASEACGRHPSEAVPSWAKLDSVRILAPTVTYTIWPTYGLHMAYMYHLHMTQTHLWPLGHGPSFSSFVCFVRSLAQGLSLAVSLLPTSWKTLFHDVSGLRWIEAFHCFSLLFCFNLSLDAEIETDKRWQKMIKEVMLSLSCGSLRFGLCSCIHCMPVESSAQPGRVRRGRRGRRLAQRPGRRVAGPLCTWQWQIHRTFRGSERRPREASIPGIYRDLWDIISTVYIYISIQSEDIKGIEQFVDTD